MYCSNMSKGITLVDQPLFDPGFHNLSPASQSSGCRSAALHTLDRWILHSGPRCCRCQKASLYGWAGGSLCTVISESWELTVLNETVRRKDESEEAWQARQAKAIADINSHSLVLFHALIQVPSLLCIQIFATGTCAASHDFKPAQPEMDVLSG